jgi:NarL family two-component system response regulator YdfI
MAQIRFILVDSLLLFRLGLKSTLRTQPQWQLVGEGVSRLELATLLATQQPQVAVVDGRLPLNTAPPKSTPENAYQLLASLPGLRRYCPTTHFLLLLEKSHSILLHLAMQARVSGCIDRDEVGLETLSAALQCIGQGQAYFSPKLQPILQEVPPALPPLSLRQLAILATLVYAPGRTYAVQAQALGITEHTLRTHMQLIYKQLGVNHRLAAMSVAIQRGWMPVETEMRNNHVG